MIMNAKYSFALSFAHIAQNMGMKPYDLAQLCVKSDLRASRYTLMNNPVCRHIEWYKKEEHAAMDEIETLAASYGYDTEWNGLYPTFIRRSDKREFTLPG